MQVIKFLRGKIAQNKGIYIVFVSIILLLFFSRKSSHISPSSNNLNPAALEVSKSVDKQQETRIPDLSEQKEKVDEEYSVYKIIYTEDKIRNDRGKTYYVLLTDLLPMQDLDFNRYKPILKQIIYEITQEYGNKLSILFFDDMGILNLQHDFDTKGLERLITREEQQNRALHLIASFDGEHETNQFLNELVYFPAASNDNPLVGKYIEDTEYTPKEQEFKN